MTFPSLCPQRFLDFFFCFSGWMNVGAINQGMDSRGGVV